MSLSSGDEFAGYTVERLLGSGGMGEVYLVRHPRLPRYEALKILPSTVTGDPAYRERFNREADIAGELWHPHIVGLHDRGESDGRLWIAMDYVDGTDAAAELRQHPSGMPAPRVVDIVTAIAEALDYAHQRGLLHRDVKPANILLSSGTGGGTADGRRILLSDFGIAKLADDISGLTETNMAVGTTAYAAPEQLMGHPMDGRADQYALAASAFHLFTGRKPFPQTNPAAVIGSHLTAAPPALSELRPDLAHLDWVIAKGMAKNPDDRFPSCADFAHALRQGVVGVYPTAAPIQGLAPGPVQPVGRGGAARILVPLALAVFLVAATVFTVSQFLRTPPPAPPAPAPSTASPEWQPYIDFAKEFALSLMSISADSADSDVQRILDQSTGGFHDDFAQQRADFVKITQDSAVTTTATVSAAGLDSLDGDQAQVLVAATSKVTNNAGAEQAPKNWRLAITVVEVDGAYKASNVEFVP